MSNSTRVRKAIFPVAGLGTRFLPATKSIPKEMLPIVDKPLIQYAVEEAIAAGIDTLIFVTSNKKHSISDHFNQAYELESRLIEDNKSGLLATIQNIIPAHITRAEVPQVQLLGLGHAVSCARELIGDEPCAVILADDLIKSAGKGCLAQLIKQFEANGNSTLAVQRISVEDCVHYGMIKASTDGCKIDSIIEKPDIDNTPSNLAVVGRYVLTPAIFSKLDKIIDNAVGEIQLTDAISLLLEDEIVEFCEFSGRRYDCGSKAGFIEATVDYALERPELRDKVLKHIADTLKCDSETETTTRI